MTQNELNKLNKLSRNNDRFLRVANVGLWIFVGLGTLAIILQILSFFR